MASKLSTTNDDHNAPINTDATNQKNTKPTSITSKLENQNKHELICLVDDENMCGLRVGDMFHALYDQFDKTQLTASMTSSSIPSNVFVISLLGNTRSGKSFTARYLLSDSDNDSVDDTCDTPVSFDDDSEGSTTANVMCFKSTTIFLENSDTNCLLLDFEGEDGASLPRLLASLQLNVSSPLDYIRRRREAVSKYFPRLAYVVSNVIVLLSEQDFAVANYVDRCYDFATRATHDLYHNLYKPVLILVHNQATGGKTLGRVTDDFFRIHGDQADKLRNFFSDIHCFRLPYRDEMRFKGKVIDGKAIFTQQMIEMRKLFASIYDQQLNRTISVYHWLMITECILDKILNGEPVMMHMLLRDMMVKNVDDLEDITIMHLFRQLFGKNPVHSTRWFHFCREFAMHVLARATAIRLYENKTNVPDPVINLECRARLDQLWRLLDEYRPCEALYMGEGYAAERNRPIFCYQHKGCHDEHRTSEGVYGLSWLYDRVERSSTVRWSGIFQSNDKTSETPSTEMYEQLYGDTKNCLTQLMESSTSIYTKCELLLREYNISVEPQKFYQGLCYCCLKAKTFQTRFTTYNRNICSQCRDELSMCRKNSLVFLRTPPIKNNDECVICMEAPRKVALLPCGHYGFCHDCGKNMLTNFGVCPLCKNEVTDIQPIIVS